MPSPCSHRISRKAKRTALALGTAALVLWGALEITPPPQELLEGPPASTRFLDRHGRDLRALLVDGQHYARPVALEEVSRDMIHATLAAEDKRFRHHPGVDPLAVVRAATNRLRPGGTRSGASTLTQQLIKSVSPGPRTLGSKLTETWRALALERDWTKDEILTAYLNRIGYGNLQAGIGAASHYYFGKPPCDLGVAESAFLAALPKAPGRLDPHRNPGAALPRQREILGRMHAAGWIDDGQLVRAAEQPLRLHPPQREFAAPHFVDLLLQRKGIPVSGGGAIATTLDLELNRVVERVLHDQVAQLANKNVTSAAAVVLFNPTGEVLALAGSSDYFLPGTGQVNSAWRPRSPGSAIKPFAYLLALERGLNPGDILPDVPTAFPTATGRYEPNNFNGRFYGSVSLRFALGNSLNVAAIRALQHAGGPEKLHGTLRAAGITTLDHPAAHYGLGLVLGNGAVRPLELASAYAALARLGETRPYRVLRDGDLVPGKRLFDPAACFLIADILADPAARAASFGMQSHLAFPFPAAAKTGTSSDYRDNWCVAFTPEFTVLTWFGNPDGKPMRGVTGVTGAAPATRAILVHLHNTRGTSWYDTPRALTTATLHPRTGRVVPEDRRGAVTEYCLHPPRVESPSDYDAGGRVVLGPEYRKWLAGPQNTLRGLAVAGEAGPLKILEPADASLFFFDPDLPPATQQVPLRASRQSVRWKIEPGMKDRPGVTTFQLVPGTHRIRAEDTATGETASVVVEVAEL